METGETPGGDLEALEEVVYFLSPILSLAGVDAEQAAPLSGGWVGGVEHDLLLVSCTAQHHECDVERKLLGADVHADGWPRPAPALVTRQMPGLHPHHTSAGP